MASSSGSFAVGCHWVAGENLSASSHKGIELHERVARRFVDELLTGEPGQILRLTDAYAVFRALLKQRDLPDIKSSKFKAVVGPLIREHFNLGLRNDLISQESQVQQCGWKGVRLAESVGA